MAREYIPVALDRLVRIRARHRCEYCQSPADVSSAPFCLDHIFPISLGGASDEANLALSCSFCNLAKGDRTEAIDHETLARVAFFHPRRQVWNEHFRWSEDGLSIVALTLTGQVTLAALGLNRIELQNLRRVLVRCELHPPTGE